MSSIIHHKIHAIGIQITVLRYQEDLDYFLYMEQNFKYHPKSLLSNYTIEVQLPLETN